MGLFSFLKPKEPLRPLEMYLNEYTADELYGLANYAVDIYVGNSSAYLITSQYAQGFNEQFYSPSVTIPKQYYKETVASTTLLDIAIEKGHADAAFMMGLFVEHGIFKSSENASTYFALAKTRGSGYIAAYEYIRTRSMNQKSTASLGEAIAFAMNMPDDDMKKYLPPNTSTSSKWWRELETMKKWGLQLLIHYAADEMPFSLGFLGTNILRRVKLLWQEEREWNGAYLDGIEGLDGFGMSHQLNAAEVLGKEMLHTLVDKAQRGDSKAVAVVQLFGIQA